MIKKRMFVFGFLVLIILLAGFVSASFFSDSWNKMKGTITGSAISMCEDSEAGNENPKDPYVRGVIQTSSLGSSADYCLNAYYLDERYCVDGNIRHEYIACEHGCYSGECNTAEECPKTCDSAESCIEMDNVTSVEKYASGEEKGCQVDKKYCYDSDGDNHAVKGGVYEVYIADDPLHESSGRYLRGTDYCSDSHTLVEYLCGPRKYYADFGINCPYGCEDGKCKGSEGSLPTYSTTNEDGLVEVLDSEDFVWTRWFDETHPNEYGYSSYEQLATAQRLYPGEVCENPLDVQCKVSGASDDEAFGGKTDREVVAAGGTNVKCALTSNGLSCVSSEHGQCLDYEVRFACPSDWSPSDEPQPGYWTSWFNNDRPDRTGTYVVETGDFEKVSDPCGNGKTPTGVDCQTGLVYSGLGVDYRATGQTVSCDIENGLVCRNEDNPGGCFDYYIRYYCGDGTPEENNPPEPESLFDNPNMTNGVYHVVPVTYFEDYGGTNGGFCVDEDGGMNKMEFGETYIIYQGVKQSNQAAKDRCDYTQKRTWPSGIVSDGIVEYTCNEEGWFTINSGFCPEDYPYCYLGECVSEKPEGYSGYASSTSSGVDLTGGIGTTSKTGYVEEDLGEETALANSCFGLGGVVCSGTQDCDGEILEERSLGLNLGEVCCLGACSDKENYFGTNCNGCLFEGECYSYGFVFNNYYCSPDGNRFLRKKSLGKLCSENFECMSGFCEQGKCVESIEVETKEECLFGCFYNERCYNVGSRVNGDYCSERLSFVSQVMDGKDCLDNYECISNICLENECISLNLFQKFVAWLKGSFFFSG
jgi:hypothetical protein